MALTAAIGTAALAITALLAFFQLKHTLNTVWNAPNPRPGPQQLRA